MSDIRWRAALGACLITSACTFAPPGLDDERARSASFGAAYDAPFEKRELPALSDAPALDELWSRALRSNGELEARWREWRAALEVVIQRSSSPNTNLSLDLEHELRASGLDTWDRTRVSLGFDPMQNLWVPRKLEAAGAAALAQAHAAGERFRERRASLKRALVETWIEWLAAHEELRELERALELRRLQAASVASSAATNGSGAESFDTRIELLRLEDESARVTSRCDELLAALNGQLARAPLEALAEPVAWPRREIAPRELELPRLLALAARHDPARASAGAETEMREREVELAKLERLPDINPFAGVVGSLETFIGASLSLPVNRARLQALLREARERRAAARAQQRDVGFTRDAALTAAARALREAERASALLENELVPLARAATANAQARLSAGGGASLDWLAARQTEVELARARIDARAERENALARIEELVGIDLESFGDARPTAEVPHE